MMRFALALLPTLALCGCSSAHAEPTLIEDSETATIYKDGAQIIVLVDVMERGKQRAILAYAKQIMPEIVPQWRNATRMGTGVPYYYARLRPIGDEIICEKFAERPDSREKYLYEQLVTNLVAMRC